MQPMCTTSFGFIAIIMLGEDSNPG